MSFNEYYLSELSALRELGKEFADENPALAPFLSQHGQDPDVERLFEGFAFLVGRLRQRLDDELPELTHSLMRLLWPNYIRPVPSISTLAFKPKPELTQKQTIKANTEVKSNKIEDTACIFKTCYDTDIYPLSIHSSKYTSTGDGGVYTIKLALENGAQLSDINLNTLRLHFHGDKSTCLTLLLAMKVRTTKLEYRLINSEGERINNTTLALNTLKEVGFEKDQALLEYPLNTFMGYRHLQEFFCYPDKYQYIDLVDLPIWPVELTKQCTHIEFSFKFEQLSMTQFYPDRAKVALFCTPIVNLFEADAAPILLNHTKTHYKLSHATLSDDKSIIVGVNSVVGWQPGTHGRIKFHDFESFEHDANNNDGQFFSIKQSPNIVTRQFDTYLSFNLNNTEHRSTTISISIKACNGSLPCKLSLGDISESTDSSPEFTTFKNITMPTQSYAPPIEKDGLWSLISNMSLNYISLTQPEALKKLLVAYDFPGAQNDTKAKQTKRLLGGIKNISTKPIDLLLQGLPVRGMNTQLTLESKHFLCEGELYLFASVLNEFFSLYTSINTVNMLSVQSSEGGNYSWSPRVGQQPVI
ncbi:type VI secretion system baseplate subunit TssF [Vibrio genomosp. F6]|uniref:Type VI secretion system protein ImpG n=1 Tax=Vibrio genomosp. F6 str. FF-238 TaxID=1191298 RepID=A0A1E5CX36_9VIBR|nr:type VI secretion system baseplate subunit TssF [Vibrio genomosp. F6]OEE75053.1 type VI secretion system protein ImpG [Vibrio genomosp. F6 str. FF-238]